MKKTTLTGVLALLCLWLSSTAQPPPAPRPLTVGDTLPDITLENVTNYPSSTIRLSDYKDKLVIIDFMRTSCKSCLEDLPKLNELQQMHEDVAKIVLVTPEEKGHVSAFFSRVKVGKENKLTIINQDSLLSTLFPHAYIPHEVWINKGIVAAITNPDYVTSDNMRKLLNNEAIAWPVKREIFDFRKELPVFALNGNNVSEISSPQKMYHSGITSHLSGISKSYYRRKDSLTNLCTLRLVNYPIIDLYLLALRQSISFPKGHILLNVKDQNRFVFDPSIHFKQQWVEDNTYTYEAVFPATDNEQLFTKKIVGDLDFLFQVSGQIVKKEIICYVLKRMPLKKGPKKLNPTINSNQKISLATLLSLLNNQKYGQVVINESGLKELAYLTVDPDDYSDIQKVNKRLQEYGLYLKQENRKVEVLVMEENVNLSNN